MLANGLQNNKKLFRKRIYYLFVVNFHTIRRSVATNLALQGTQIYDIMILLNHTTTKQTQDYLNLDNESLGKETNRLFSSIFRAN